MSDALLAFDNNSKVNRLVLITSACGFIKQSYNINFPLAMVPMKEDLGFSAIEQGWLLSAFSIGYLTTQILGGFLASRFERKLLFLSVFLSSLCLLVTPFIAQSFELLMINRILMGTFSGVIFPAIYGLYGKYVPASYQPHTRLVSAGILGLVFALLTVPSLQWTTMFILYGLGGQLWCLCWMYFFREPESLIKTGDDSKENERTLELSDLKAKEIPKDASGAKSISWKQIRSLFTNQSFIALVFAHTCDSFVSHLLLSWLPIYFNEKFGIEKTQMSILMFPYLCRALLSERAGPIANWMTKTYDLPLTHTRKLMAGIAFFAPAIVLPLFAVISDLLSSILLLSLILALVALHAAGYLSNPGDLSRPHAGLIYSISSTIAGVPNVFMGPLVAVLKESWMGWSGVFVLSAGVNVIGGCVFVIFGSANQIPELL